MNAFIKDSDKRFDEEFGTENQAVTTQQVKELKKFNRAELLTFAQKMREEVEEMKFDELRHDSDCPYKKNYCDCGLSQRMAFNQALEEVKKKI